MKFITFDRYKCDNCYKCLRICPTKAIAFTEERREIIDALCIKCGRCQSNCHPKALEIQNDKYKIRKALALGKPIAVSLAPSYAGAFLTDSPSRLAEALLQLGFGLVEETALAAEAVSRRYEAYLSGQEPDNMITSCCPSANLFIEQRYPELLHYVAPVVSPMVAHGRMLKDRLGPDWEVAFIGPCLAKKAEAEEMAPDIDYVLTFNELSQWLQEAGITVSDMPGHLQLPRPTVRGAAYPLGGSLFDRHFKEKLRPEYRYIRAEGLARLTDVLESLKEGRITGYCIEVNMCNGSCVNGPDMPGGDSRYYERKDRMQTHLEPLMQAEADGLAEAASAERLHRIFHERPVHLPTPDAAELTQILADMGKHTEEDQLNCGACGYNSCIDKATAIHRGLANQTMCVPYMKSIAEGLQTAIFQCSPNAICIVDESLRIMEFNPAFAQAFEVSTRGLKHTPITGFLPECYFRLSDDGTCAFSSQRVQVPFLDRVFLLSTVWLKPQKAYVCILTDITLSENRKQELQELKAETLSSCQELIDRQMQMVQEIAGMLGESAAEAKISITRLTKLVSRGEEIQDDVI